MQVGKSYLDLLMKGRFLKSCEPTFWTSRCLREERDRWMFEVSSKNDNYLGETASFKQEAFQLHCNFGSSPFQSINVLQKLCPQIDWFCKQRPVRLNLWNPNNPLSKDKRLRLWNFGRLWTKGSGYISERWPSWERMWGKRNRKLMRPK